MAIGFSGISTGADWNGIINQLLQIESRPLLQLQSREDDIDDRISDYGKVKSAVDAFRSAVDDLRDSSSLESFTAASSDENVLTATAGLGAVASSYDVVISALATKDKIASSLYADSATAVGTGTLTLTVNGSSMNITIGAGNNTLAGIRNAINAAADNPGVTATLLNESGGSRLILTSDETGESNAIGISFSDGDDANNADENGLSKLFYIGAGDDGYAEQVSVATNAQLTIDGFDIDSESNTVSGAIDGVTLNILSAGSSTVSFERDNAAFEETVKTFVDSYNSFKTELERLEDGSLSSDSSLRRIRQGFTDIMNQSATIDGASAYLFEIGVTRDKDGRLSLDSSDLSAALSEDFDRVLQLFADDSSGFATRLYTYADALLESGGIISSMEEGLQSRKRSIQDQIERQQYHLDIYEKNLVNQFMALDQTLAGLQGTSNYLAGQLSSLMG